MRPLELIFIGLRSYRQQQKVDLRGHTLVGITGATGAGKSTVLEAIFFALYGTCTFPAPGPKVLIADGGTGTLSVELTFEARGKTWKVTRSMSRGSAPAVHRLEELDGGGAWGGKRDVNRRIHELVGLDQDTFIRSVILPQGRFDQLLHTHPGARAGTLKALLGLDQLDRVHDRARDRHDGLLPVLNELLQRRAGLMPDPRAVAAAADRERAAAQAQLKALRGGATELEKLQRERAAIEQQAETVREQTEQLRKEACRDHDSRLRRLADLDVQITVREEAAKAEAVPLRERHDALLAELGDRRPSGSLADAASTAVGVLARLRDRVAREGELTEQIAVEAASIAEVARLAELTSQDAAKRMQLAEEAAKVIEASQGRERAAVEHLQCCKELLRRVRELAGRVEQLTADLEEKERDHDDAEDGFRIAQQLAEQAEEGLAEAVREHDAQKRMHAAAHAAEGLAAGDDCPVCAHPLPADFLPPQAPGLHAAEQREKAARKKVTAAQAAFTQAVVAKAGAGAGLGQARAALSSHIEEHAAAVANLIADLGVVDLASDDAVILSVPTAAAEEARRNTAAVVHRVGEVQAAAARAKAEAEAQAGELTRRRKALARERQALAEVQDAIAKRLAEVPEPYRPQEPIIDAIDAQRKQARDDKEQLSKHWRELASLQEQLGAIDEKLAGLAKRLLREVAQPAARLRQGMVDIVARHNPLAGMVGAPAVSTGDPVASISEQAMWAEGIADSARALLDKASHRLDGFTELLQRCDDKAREVLQAAPTDGLELDEAVHAVTGKAAVAAQKRDEATAQIAEADDLDRRIEGARPHVEALGDLVALLKDGKFVAAVVRERQQSLLGIATGLLRGMTLGRFSFGPEFDIYDAHTGLLRDVRTLSGGETFQASLALALAVVEQASRTSGRTEALFLDEGFGTLDQDALAHALDSLTAQVRAGRLVVVISHMRAVAQHVPALLKVEDSPAGSRIRWVDDAERADLAEDGYLDGLQE